MTPESRIKLKNLLLLHENYKQFPYVDTTGHLTVGIGRNLTDRGVSTTEAFQLLEEDILYFYSHLSNSLSVFNTLNETRQIALIDMCFNLGVKGFFSFKRMIKALEEKNFLKASHEMLSSKWATQVNERAIRLAKMILTGEFYLEDKTHGMDKEIY